MHKIINNYFGTFFMLDFDIEARIHQKVTKFSPGINPGIIVHLQMRVYYFDFEIRGE